VQTDGLTPQAHGLILIPSPTTDRRRRGYVFVVADNGVVIPADSNTVVASVFMVFGDVLYPTVRATATHS